MHARQDTSATAMQCESAPVPARLL